MTLAEASAGFLASISEKHSTSSDTRLSVQEKSLGLLNKYFPSTTSPSEVTSLGLRDFLGRWYVETACSGRHQSEPSPQSDSRQARDGTTKTSRDDDARPAESESLPQPGELLDSLSQFFRWCDQSFDAEVDLGTQSEVIIDEMRNTLPRALKITRLLSNLLRERGGAFGFPEFLTSFEEGGHSEYDIDTPGSVGALEGYFRIVRVEGSSVEAEELISEERVRPVIFPPEIASLLDDQYIINLELVRSSAGWQIAGCGFAYPPGTEV